MKPIGGTRPRRASLAAAVVLAGTSWLGCGVLKDDGLPPGDGDASTGLEAGPPFDASPDSNALPSLDASAAADSWTDGAQADAFDGGSVDVQISPLTGPPWGNDVPTCWANVADALADQDAAAPPGDPEPTWVHDHVESSWGHEANLRFGDWLACPAEGSGIALKVAIAPPDAGAGADGGGDAQAPSPAWGGSIDGAGTNTGSTPGEPAKVTFWPVAQPAGDAARETLSCAVDRIFSRVLGLADDPAAQPLGAALCGDAANPILDMRLSPLQILRARRVYGAKPAGSVVSFDGRCLTASASSSGSVVSTDDCRPDASGLAGTLQRWRFDPWAQSLVLGATGLALDSHGAGRGTQAIVGDKIAESPDQLWRTSGASVRGIGGTCLDFQTTPDARVVLWPCSGASATQRFDFGPGASIRATTQADAGTPLCLSETAGAVGAAPCDGSSAQSWSLVPGGGIRSLSAGGCVEATLADSQNPEVGLEEGVPLRVTACAGSDAQRFDIFGVLLASPAAPTCLDVAAYVRADRTTIWSWPCVAGIAGVVGGTNEWWDVTW